MVFFLAGREWRMKRMNKSITLWSADSDTASIAYGPRGSAIKLVPCSE